MIIETDMNDKFYDFINMYNAIIKHCTSKNRRYNIKIYFVGNNLYFEVIDKETNTTLHTDSVECSRNESKLIYNMITSEFILNHQLRFTAYSPMTSADITLFNCLSNREYHITNDSFYYYFDEEKQNDQRMIIHIFENSVFTLNIYEYYGINKQTEILHQMALDKINATNEKILLKK